MGSCCCDGLHPVGSPPGGLTVEDESVFVAVTSCLNFLGAGVTAVNNLVTGCVDITITGAVIPVGGPPTTVDAGDVASPGVGPAAAFFDHEHAVNTSVLVDLGSQVVGAGSAGVSLTLPRGDHVHPMASAAPGATIEAGDAAVEGVAVTVSRTDHQHAVSTAVVADIAPVAAAASAGVSTTLPRGDHVHALPSQWGRTYQATWEKEIADVLGTTTTPERAFDRNGMVAGAVWTFVSGVFVPNAAVPAGVMGNTATLSIEVRTAAGGVIGTLGTITVGAAWGANVSQAVVAGAVTVVNPGEYVTIRILKTGVAGRVIPAGALELTFTVA